MIRAGRKKHYQSCSFLIPLVLQVVRDKEKSWLRTRYLCALIHNFSRCNWLTKSDTGIGSLAITPLNMNHPHPVPS